MTMQPIEPLDPRTWLDRLAKLQDDALCTPVKSTESLVRQAYHLTRLAPGPYRQLLPVDLDEETIERMLACAAYESAAMALMGQEIDFTVRKHARAREFEVEVSIERGTPPGRATHEECAKAVLCAWVCSLTHVAGLAAPGAVKDQVPRKSRSGSPPSSTAH